MHVLCCGPAPSDLLLQLAGLLLQQRGFGASLCTSLGLLLQVLDLPVDGGEGAEVSGHKLLLLLLWLRPPSSLLLVVLDEALGLAVLPLQGLILGLGLLQVLIHGLAETLRLHPVALQLLHALLVLLQRLLQLGLVQPPALLLLLSVVQLRTEGEERSKVSEWCDYCARLLQLLCHCVRVLQLLITTAPEYCYY